MTLKLRKQLLELGSVLVALASLYGIWAGMREAFGFEEKSTAQVIGELRAEDTADRTRDSISIVDRAGIRALTEANTIMICSLVDSSLKYNSQLPCKRLLRERGIE